MLDRIINLALVTGVVVCCAYAYSKTAMSFAKITSEEVVHYINHGALH